MCQTKYDPRTRTLHHIDVVCSSAREAHEWENRIINAGYGADPKDKESLPRKKKILALLNPFGGRGLAPRKYEVAMELLNLCHIEVELKHTERRNHAFEIARDEIQVGQYDGIMTVSGDGLIHETINGFMSRPDRDECLNNINMGFIPAGTANGLHKSVTNQFNEKDGIHSAAFATAKGRTTKMDLTELELEYWQNEPRKKLYMFLAMQYAIVADCDINSEVLRCMGNPRFYVWGFYRTLIYKNYPAELIYSGKEAFSNKKRHTITQNDI